MNVSCPQCNQESHIVKVSEMPGNQQQQSSILNPVVASSKLPDRFSPPSEPQKPTRKSLWLYLFGAACLISSFTDPKFLGPVFWFFIGVGLILAGYNKDKELSHELKKYETNQQEWQEKMRLWNDLYYCNSCDIVFNTKGQSQLAPPDKEINLTDQKSSSSTYATNLGVDPSQDSTRGFLFQNNKAGIIAVILILLAGWYLFFHISVEGNYHKVPFPGRFTYTNTYRWMNFKDGKVEIEGIYGKYNYEINNDVLIIHSFAGDVPFKILNNGRVLENRDNGYLGRYERE